MKIIAVNGSPRKEWNTATLIKKALEGASAQGAQTELINLYELRYRGCISCFACKEKDGKSYGECVVKDDLTPVYKEMKSADAFILGSPIYLGSITGETQSFLERLVFPYLTYTNPPGSLFPRKIDTGFVYTMGLTDELMKEFGYTQRFSAMEGLLARIFGRCESLYCCDTYQFDDYSKVVAPRFDPEKKKKRRDEVFPQDCQKAFAMGARFAGKK
jgi:multimeric flavodoxin WrbA